MSFDGKEEHRISLQEARTITKRYREKPENKGKPRAHYVGRGVLDEILAQPGCVGLRIYHANKRELDPNQGGSDATLVIVGVTADERDMVNGVIAERTWVCPPYCSTQTTIETEG